jgi:hypothetical protein
VASFAVLENDEKEEIPYRRHRHHRHLSSR